MRWTIRKHPSECQQNETQSGCRFGEKCFFMHRESAQEKPKKTGGKGSLAILKNCKQSGCVFQDTEPPKFNSFFTEGHKILGTGAQRAILKGYITPRENSVKKGPSQGVIQHSDPHERGPLMLQNYEDRYLRKKP